MKKKSFMKKLSIIILFFIVTNNFVFAQKNDFSLKSTLFDSKIDTSNINIAINRWQFSIGYSINNNGIYNISGSYIIPINNHLNLLLNLRPYDMPTLTFTLNTKKIKVYNNFALSFGIGTGFSELPLLMLGWPVFVFELNLKLYFLDTQLGNLFVEINQINALSLSTISENEVENKPIRFLSLGIEF